MKTLSFNKEYSIEDIQKQIDKLIKDGALKEVISLSITSIPHETMFSECFFYGILIYKY